YTIATRDGTGCGAGRMFDANFTFLIFDTQVHTDPQRFRGITVIFANDGFGIARTCAPMHIARIVTALIRAQAAVVTATTGQTDGLLVSCFLCARADTWRIDNRAICARPHDHCSRIREVSFLDEETKRE